MSRLCLTGEARRRALEAEREARLAEASDTSLKPTVEILSLDGTLGGPIATLKEGVISGMEVHGSDGSLLTSGPDQMKFTYEIEVDGRGAWGSDNEGGGDAEGEEAERLGDLNGRSKKRSSRQHKAKNGQVTQGNVVVVVVVSYFHYFLTNYFTLGLFNVTVSYFHHFLTNYFYLHQILVLFS